MKILLNKKLLTSTAFKRKLIFTIIAAMSISTTNTVFISSNHAYAAEHHEISHNNTECKHTDKSAIKQHTLSFNYLDKTFEVKVLLPKKCKISTVPANYMPLIGPDTKAIKLNDRKYALMGVEAFGEKADGTEISDSDPNRLMEIYSNIALGNDYHFNVKDTYKKVWKDDVSEAGICEVYRSPSIAGGKEKKHIGIVYYNKDSKIVFAIELNRKYSNKKTLKEAKKIAKSISLN